MPEDGRVAHAVVGRDREREQLTAACTRAAAGEPGAVVVSGEAGIGKTTLLEAFAADTDATVLVGNCFPVAGEALPFAPVVQALRDLAHTLPAERRERLAPYWPSGLARLAPLGADAALPDSDPLGDADGRLSLSSQSRMFESVLSLLAELAAARPAVLVVEDLHWADRSTLDLLTFLALNVRTEALLLVLSVRSDDLSRDHPLRPWLVELGRLPNVERLTVARLDRHGTAEQLAELLGQHPADDLVETVHHHAAGNPLFTAQALPWVQDPAGPLPDTLRELVEARLGALPDETRRVLEVASVLGRSVELDVLAAVAGISDVEVEDALVEALDRSLVEPRPGPAYAFRHPMFREVLEAGLLPGNRRRLHRAAATVLEDSGSTRAFARSAQVARHWQSAQVPDRAFRAAVLAGLAAEEVFAFAAADDLFTRALDLAKELPAEVFEGLPVDPCDLVSHASQAAHLVGDGTRAVELAGQAVECCDDPARQPSLLERRGTYCFNAGLAEEAGDAFRAALELLPAEPATAARARVLGGLALLAMAWSRMDEARSWCEQALEVARAAGARAEEARALDALGVVTVYGGDFDTGLGYSRASLAIAEEVGEPDELAGAYIDLAHVLGLAGRFDEAVEVCSDGYRRMQQLGLARQDGSFLQANAAESLTRSGRWAEATELVDSALAQRPRGMRAFPILVRGAQLALAQGRFAVATARLDLVRELADTYGLPDAWRRELYETSADLALWEHRPDDAMDAVEAGLTLVEKGDEQRFAGPLVQLAARAAADLVEQARAERDPDGLERARTHGALVVGQARGFDPDPLDPSQHPLPETRALAVTTEAERLRAGETARGPEAADAWSAAAEAWQLLGRPLPVAYARWREAEALVLAKHPGRRPVTALRTAWSQARELGAEALVAEVERLAASRRVDLFEAPDAPAVSSAVSAAGSAASAGNDLGLTARELEVLGALVGGSTNREIADSLFISIKTVSVHVSNILRKLQVTNREEAARAAYRLGLVPGG